MANCHSNKIDRLSNLSVELLVTILSLLPTHIAARTSLLSRHFRHLWEASPSLNLISQDLPHPTSNNFAAMAERALLSRNPSHPLLSLRLEVSRCDLNASFLSSLLAKACSLDLRHLTINDFMGLNFSPFIDIIFTINSLRSFFLDYSIYNTTLEELIFPSGMTLTCLRRLSLSYVRIDPAKFNRLLSELCSLEVLHLKIERPPGLLSLSSKTIRILELIAHSDTKIENLSLSLPSLEFLDLDLGDRLQSSSHIHGEFPLLRKAVIDLCGICERNVSAVARLLNCISHVEVLGLRLTEIWNGKFPIPILLESGKGVSEFHKLEHLGLSLCCHDHNLEAVTKMLHNCPSLKSLVLVHQIPTFSRLAWARARKKDWGSRLPRNADHAYFENLHLEKNRKEVIKLLMLSKKCFSNRQARSS